MIGDRMPPPGLDRPELLAPAGTPDKLRTALHFGADAVYLGLDRFSLRARAGNFDLDELEWALGYAHDRSRKVYVALNIQPFDGDLEGIEATLGDLARLGADAAIVADPAVLAIARRAAPGLRLHLSTQASVTNAEAARFWLGAGISRVILARELSVDQLRRLVPAAGGEIEVFVHGAVCIAYSGRCLLSLYWAGRDTRRGECAQGCRWPYRAIVDRRRPAEANPVEEDERGTYFFDAKDLCALPVLAPLLETGVRALKIEGRTRSRHTVGVTVDVYRHAVDRVVRGERDGVEADLPRYLAEVARTCSRGVSTHFLGGEQDLLASYNPGGSFAERKVELIGEVVGRDEEGLLLSVQNPLRPGTALELRRPGLRCEAFVAERLAARDGAPVDLARTGDLVRVPARLEAEPGDLVRLAEPLRTSR